MSTCNPLNLLELGRVAEAVARAYLIERGLNIVLENFRCRVGELDPVALNVFEARSWQPLSTPKQGLKREN